MQWGSGHDGGEWKNRTPVVVAAAVVVRREVERVMVNNEWLLR